MATIVPFPRGSHDEPPGFDFLPDPEDPLAAATGFFYAAVMGLLCFWLPIGVAIWAIWFAP